MREEVSLNKKEQELLVLQEKLASKESVSVHAVNHFFMRSGIVSSDNLMVALCRDSCAHFFFFYKKFCRGLAMVHFDLKVR